MGSNTLPDGFVNDGQSSVDGIQMWGREDGVDGISSQTQVQLSREVGLSVQQLLYPLPRGLPDPENSSVTHITQSFID